MQRSEAVLYIKNIIKKARTPLSDEYAAICVAEGREPSKDVQFYARTGALDQTASYLKLARLSTRKNGEILATAYARATLKGKRVTVLYPPNEQVIIERKAQQANRIAQKLTRAVRRLQNS